MCIRGAKGFVEVRRANLVENKVGVRGEIMLRLRHDAGGKLRRKGNTGCETERKGKIELWGKRRADGNEKRAKKKSKRERRPGRKQTSERTCTHFHL